ncbi:hypothetical protein PRIPAC_89863 [Pristionchus pacificus]|uniref:Uncharacterized protein n=1 Tax=Pristionchus pacificus TaxID=54126 RepID=A0A2A6B5M4_PRIPA|nr:hypothetical protein PRIPAC_89863 [Pristionchus pacificus]|eukprot:PDM61172.1 hypothetical protein PRIPAC_50614 [Pristionchus pacificus]
MLSLVSFNLWIAFFDRGLFRVANRNPIFAPLFCTMRQATSKLTAFQVAHRMQDQQNGDIYFNWLSSDLNKKRNSVGSITHQF